MRLHHLALAVSISLLTLSAPGFAQSKETKRKKTASAPAPALTPYLVAISVANLDETTKWYEEKLGFVVTRKLDLPDYALRMAFAELNGFRLEFIEFKQSVPFEAIQQQFPKVDDRAKMQGYGKLGFRVQNIEAMAKRLKEKGVKFEHDVTDDQEFGVKWFIVTDNSGNMIQFFQPKKVPNATPSRLNSSPKSLFGNSLPSFGEATFP